MTTRALAPLIALLLTATDARAQSRLSIGLQGGFAVEQPLNDYEPSYVKMGLAEVQIIGALLGPPNAPRLEVVSAVMLGQSLFPDSRFTIGTTEALRLHIPSSGNVGVYLEAGAGFVSTGIHAPPELSGPFQYALQAGAGCRVKAGRRSTVNIAYRWQHFSSNDLTLPNQGLNLHTVIVGFSRRLN